MKWSWRIAKVAGIDVRIHATFGLLLAWVAASEYLGTRSVAAAVQGVVFIVAVFATIVLHELAHALVGKRFGVRTREITLLPIGGIARLERMPERPLQELLMTAAGPAVNVAIGLMLLAVLRGRAAADVLQGGAVGLVPFLARLMWVNLALAVFNLVPAFPMDGGRMLRALLATRMKYARATRLAARIGQGIAIGLGILGLFSNPFLLLVAVFVWLGAAAETADAEMRATLAGVSVGMAMETDIRTLAPDDRLERAVASMLEGAQHVFPVVEGGRVIGLVGRGTLLRALRSHALDAPVRVAIAPKLRTTEPSALMTDVLAGLREIGGAMPVVEQGRLVGLLTGENVAELVEIQDALGRREEGSRGRADRDTAPTPARMLRPAAIR